MVAIKFRGATLVGALLMLCSSAHGDVKPRFEGLRNDTTYMKLIAREAQLADCEDEMLDEVDDRRSQLKVGDEKARKSLESLEFDLFDLQRERSTVTSQVQDIEQRWELQHIDISNSGVATESSSSNSVEIVGESVGSVAESKLVREMLSANDYELMQSAEQSERAADSAHTEFMTKYQRMRDLQQLYAQCESEEEAAKYMNEFISIEPIADSLLNVLGDEWSSAYSDKTYLFSLILEVLDREDTLQQGEAILREGAAATAAAPEGRASIAVSYDAEKRALLGYELLIADVLKLSRAAVNLRGELSKMQSSGDVEMLSDVTIKERNFIKYDDIKFSSSQTYSKSKPIPVAKLYKKGRVYRIQLGAYKTPQSPTIFRGAYPLSYDRALGFWTCYTGAYATMVEAQKAQLLCKKRGFNRPEIVAWRDGERRNINRQPLPATKGYRVSITMGDGMDLTPTMESIIERVCGEAEITRIGGDRYIVGELSHIYIAEDLVEALSYESDEMRFEINEIK